MMRNEAVSSSRGMRPALTFLIFCLALNVAVTVAVKLSIRGALARQVESENEFLFAWLPAATQIARVLTGSLTLAALAMLVARLHNGTRRTAWGALAATTVAFGAMGYQLIGAVFDVSATWTADWRVDAFLNNATAVATTSLTASLLCAIAGGHHAATVALQRGAIAFIVIKPIVYCAALSLPTSSTFIPYVRAAQDVALVASQVLLVILGEIARRSVRDPRSAYTKGKGT